MLSALAFGLAVQAAGPSTSHEVTVYNQGFGLVKETRLFDLKSGRQTVEVKDVAEQIEPNSVGIKSLTSPDDFQVLEQNYQYDLISTQAILNKSVGQKVRFIRHFDSKEEVIEGTLISAPYAIVNQNGYSNQTYNGMVVKTDDGRILLNPTGEVEVSQVPPGMISVPTLLWNLNTSKAGQQQVELSYLTKGLNWNADYVLTLGEKNTADLQGWVTIDNQSGATYTDAKLKLLAGDVRRIEPQNQGGFGGGGGLRVAKAADEAQFQQENLFEYHLYTLQRPATLNNRETKQISLLQGTGVKYVKKLIIDSLHDAGQYYPSEAEVGTGDLKPLAQIEFVNSKENSLGMPLPRGTVKVYQRDSSGSVQMLGEDQIDHTPKDETITLSIGRSFDIVASRKRTDFKWINSRTAQESFEIVVRNRKDTSDLVDVYERHYGDWNVTQKSMDFKKLDAWTMDFPLNLKAGESKTITYTVVTKWG